MTYVTSADDLLDGCEDKCLHILMMFSLFTWRITYPLNVVHVLKGTLCEMLVGSSKTEGIQHLLILPGLGGVDQAM